MAGGYVSLSDVLVFWRAHWSRLWPVTTVPIFLVLIPLGLTVVLNPTMNGQQVYLVLLVEIFSISFDSVILEALTEAQIVVAYASFITGLVAAFAYCWTLSAAFAYVTMNALVDGPPSLRCIPYRAALVKSCILINFGVLVSMPMLAVLTCTLAIAGVIVGMYMLIFRSLAGLYSWHGVILCVLLSVSFQIGVIKFGLDYALGPCFVMDGHSAGAAKRLSKALIVGHRMQLVRLHVVFNTMVVGPSYILIYWFYPLYLPLWLFVYPMPSLFAPFLYRALAGRDTALRATGYHLVSNNEGDVAQAAQESSDNAEQAALALQPSICNAEEIPPAFQHDESIGHTYHTFELCIGLHSNE